MKQFVMTRALFLACVFLIFSATKSSKKKVRGGASANEIMKRAEEIRAPRRAQMLVKMDNHEKGESITYDMGILAGPEKKSYVEFLGPSSEIGRKMLARGHQYWSRLPDSKKVIQVSKKEMIGNSAFSIADLFQIDTEKDYNAKIIKEEDRDGVRTIQLQLDEKSEEAPYHQIMYWVEKEGYFPVRAEFFGISGKHLKTLTVLERAKLAGMLRPKELRMQDEVVKKHYSIWRTEKMEAKEVPDEVFTKDYLDKGKNFFAGKNN